MISPKLRALAPILATFCATAATFLPTVRGQAQRDQYPRSGGNIEYVRAGSDAAELRYDSSNALVIGMSNYASGWNPLPGVKDDVKEVRAVLEELGFDVISKMDLTHQEFAEVLNDFIAKKCQSKRGRVVVYFAGHGYTVQAIDGPRGFVVPINAPDPDQDLPEFEKYAIDMEQFNIYARRIRARHVLFVFDSCFSGTLFQVMRSKDLSDDIKGRLARPVRAFITAGTTNQQVPDRSVFRRAFVDALKGGADLANTGYVTGAGLADYIRSRATTKYQTPQWGKSLNPEYSEGDIVFFLPEKKHLADSAIQLEVLIVNALKLNAAGSLETGSEQTRKQFREKLSEGVYLEMVEIPPGRLKMGSTDREGDRTERPLHEVAIPRFFIARYEITQAQWRAIATIDPADHTLNEEPSYYRGSGYEDDERPVERVSWSDAVKFCASLSRVSQRAYRLPTEAEWEYACRANTNTDYSFGFAISSGLMHCRLLGKPTLSSSSPTGTSRVSAMGYENEFGLFGMHGNVAEWCLDRWHEDYYGAPNDGSAWVTGGDENTKVIRGGSWADPSYNCRSAARAKALYTRANSTTGFRVVCVIP